MATKQSTIAPKWGDKDRVYKLKRNAAPLSFMIPTRNTQRSPLLHYDEAKGYNRALRYSRNQRSCFEDEQDGNIIVEAIIFEDGMLTVPKSNPVLQQFLYYHPLNGKKFEEVDNEKDAQQEVEMLTAEVDALIEARNLTIDQMEVMGRVLFDGDISMMSTAELKRDLLVYAKRSPVEFLMALRDPETHIVATTKQFFDMKLLNFRNNKKDIHFNLSDNKKRLIQVPYGESPYEFLATWFKTDEGLEVFEFLEKQLQ